MVVDGRFRLRVPELLSLPLVFFYTSLFGRLALREISSSLTSEANPGAESVRMTVGGPSSGAIEWPHFYAKAKALSMRLVESHGVVRRYAFAYYQDQLSLSLDDVSSIGNSYDFWGFIRRLNKPQHGRRTKSPAGGVVNCSLAQSSAKRDATQYSLIFMKRRRAKVYPLRRRNDH